MASMRFPLVIAWTVASSLWFPGSWAIESGPPTQAKPTADAEPPTALSQLAPGTVASTYVDGKLTVKARNARLIDVLYSVCDLIGAQLNAPEDASQPILRVVGPARPVDVLASLLRDSPFDYSISGSANDPNAVVGVTVFTKDKKGNKDNRDKGGDSPSPAQQAAQQVQDLVALAQSELAVSGIDDATEGKGSDTGSADSGNADSSSRSAQAFLKALENDPNLISKLQARINNGGTDPITAVTDANSNLALPPVPPDPGGVSRRRGH
jgi:hypothetical protein